MSVQVRCQVRRQSVHDTALIRLGNKILKIAGEPRAVLGLELVGNDRIRRLNRDYRGQDCSTDVLAFAYREAPGPSTPLLGDVAISLPTAAAQAESLGHSLDEELSRLLVHGILHLLGFDHERGKREALLMHRKERAIMAQLRPIPRLVKG